MLSKILFITCVTILTLSCTTNTHSISVMETDVGNEGVDVPEIAREEETETPMLGEVTTDFDLPTGYEARRILTDLSSPTQMAIGPDGWLWLTQLGGRETGNVGQLLAISLQTGEKRILLENLLTPTGLAILDGAAWIATATQLLRVPIINNGVGDIEVVIDELPNFRSSGTLSVTPDNHLLYTTNQNIGDEAAIVSPGTVWQLDPAKPETAVPLVTGFTIPYAHAFDNNGRLWVTNVTDEVTNGEVRPDAFALVPLDTAPTMKMTCFFYEPPTETDVSEICNEATPSLFLLPPHATPTSIVASPWQDDTIFVALWMAGEVIRTPLTFNSNQSKATGEWETFLIGLERAHHLTTFEESLLVSDYATGTIYQIVKTK